MPVRSRMCLTLPPDENALPAPVRITTRTLASPLMRCTAASKASIMSGSEIGLRRSGRFIVSVTMEPSCS